MTKKAPDNILLHTPLPDIYMIRFQLIEEEMVRKVAIKQLSFCYLEFILKDSSLQHLLMDTSLTVQKEHRYQCEIQRNDGISYFFEHFPIYGMYPMTVLTQES